MSSKSKQTKSHLRDTSYTVQELKNIAKTRKIKGYSTMRKAELCDILGISNADTTKCVPTKGVAAPVSILKKIHTDTLLPVTLQTMHPKTNKNVEIMVYIKPNDKNKLQTPCIINSVKTLDGSDCKKPVIEDRDEYARKANIELEKDKKELASKKKTKRKITFDV